jgi:hypothetical protein
MFYITIGRDGGRRLAGRWPSSKFSKKIKNKDKKIYKVGKKN